MRTRRFTIICNVILATLFLWASGCASWSTYPPVETTAKFVRAESGPIANVAAASIQYAHAKYTPDETLAFNLPPGSPPALYEAVLAYLEGKAKPMEREGQPAIHVVEIRTRGFNAQADVIYVRADGLHQMVTLTLQKSIASPYRVVRAHGWAVRKLDLPPPTFVAAAGADH